MSKRPQADFEAILEESGVPVTEEVLEAKLKKEVIGAGSKVSNDSEMSPFWSWVRAAVVTIAVWLIQVLLAKHIMPNMFVATGERWALELKAWELNITPKEAVKTQGFITLTKANIDDVIAVAKGSIIQTLPIEGIVYQVIVMADTTLKGGSIMGKVAVEALDSGAAFNLPSGYFNILPEALSGIVAAVNEPDWITRLGANEETDEELALRLQNAFTSSGNWHIDDAYRSIISSVAGIRSDNIYFENTGNIQPGTATAFIVMEVGPTPQTVLEQLNKYIMEEGNHGHGDVVICKAIPDVQYDVIAEVVLEGNLTNEQKKQELREVQSRIRAAFRETEAFNEMTRAKPISRFSLSLMASEIHTNMALVKSVKFIVGEKVQEDIISALDQPRLNTLTVREVLDV
ncbi:baseplate J/gp47 family protein [Aliivibrio fischeri]|uniref:baseplate J/gp47 family protein n=1 Tax=Aliivibrio fischeri TaxID=668 RepID=UPI0007C49BD6|nr:baseplate J/gp47 family protein [Aliivibrio fischeri]MBP3140140.1 baseplate J/gp47 family protein [Aliivibrio fischeri]MBP3154522.1 baseplate J/gp47 family protein [Aliivibrio fischeri]MCE7572264.1 baseplate J/gp47 family protein [Aliivibrio fischeri]